MRIIVDADGCPGKNLIEKAASRKLYRAYYVL